MALPALPPLLIRKVIRLFGAALRAGSFAIRPLHCGHSVNANLLITKVLNRFE
jgi:hypothetical protein